MTELEVRAKNGDQDAFAQLVRDNEKRVYNLALRMVGNPADAEDVAQEAFLNAWKGLAFFKGDSTFATWVYRLTTNAAIDFLRRRETRRTGGQLSLDDEAAADPVDPAPSPQEALERSEQKEALRRGLAALSEEHRQVLEMRAMDGLSYEEIGQLLDLPSGTVKSRLARGRLALKKILTQNGNLSAFFPSMETEAEQRR